MPIAVALDGPAGAGKSSIAKRPQRHLIISILTQEHFIGQSGLQPHAVMLNRYRQMRLKNCFLK